MEVEGLKSQGSEALERPSGAGKPNPKAGGKSFQAALQKAQEEIHPASADQPESGGNPIDAIRIRMQSGYYQNPKIDDALSDKLSGFFDGIA